ncbi:MAG TPA: hypothetical protein DEA90_03755 [Opitutae bacterium]|nr:hypothetical protein [Puniceicoccaceae bacterium]HBR93259.1 hypothetical protein [Opitutae bacterium]|tara:strand:- start:11722 stop:12465 length:744 start_codon:yes stop_codon:yes gene_type:complete
MKKSDIKSFLFPVILAALIGPLSANAVSLPYSNDFSSDVDDFTAATSGNYKMLDGAYRYDDGYGGASRVALLDIPEIGGTITDFTMSTTLSATDVDGDGSFGFALFSENVITTTENIIADWSPNNLLRIHNAYGSGEDLETLTTTDVTFADDAEYTLTATGHISGTSLDLTLDISDGSDTESISVSGIDVSTYLSNPYFGYRTYSPAAHELIVDYDNLSIIPEPSTAAALLGGLSLGMVLLRRRKNA